LQIATELLAPALAPESRKPRGLAKAAPDLKCEVSYSICSGRANRQIDVAALSGDRYAEFKPLTNCMVWGSWRRAHLRARLYIQGCAPSSSVRPSSRDHSTDNRSLSRPTPHQRVGHVRIFSHPQLGGDTRAGSRLDCYGAVTLALAIGFLAPG
jgi:hypothetical protein